MGVCSGGLRFLPAQERLQEATRLAEALRRLANLSIDVPTAQTAWHMLWRNVSMALAFDERILPAGQMYLIAAEHARLLHETAAGMMPGQHLPPHFKDWLLAGLAAGGGGWKARCHF